MGALSEMSLEPAGWPIPPGQVVLANVEVNNRCAFTEACGDHCYLNLLRSGTATLPDESLFNAANRLMEHGATLRHVVVAGKEPFSSGEMLLRIAESYHSLAPTDRPGSLGVLSASATGIQRWLPRLERTPLSWLAVSVDSPASGLRTGNPFQVLDAALAGRAAGGAEAVAVNTTFQAHTLAAVEAIGTALRGKAVDQWTTSALMLPLEGVMTSTANFDTTTKMIAIAERLLDVAGKVVVETSPEYLRQIVGEAYWTTVNLGVWRIEYQLPSGVWLFARAPVPGYFLRVRHDGALLSKEDFTKIGLKTGRYGIYRDPSDIDRAVAELRRERQDYNASVPTEISYRIAA